MQGKSHVEVTVRTQRTRLQKKRAMMKERMMKRRRMERSTMKRRIIMKRSRMTYRFECFAAYPIARSHAVLEIPSGIREAAAKEIFYKSIARFRNPDDLPNFRAFLLYPRKPMSNVAHRILGMQHDVFPRTTYAMYDETPQSKLQHPHLD